MKLDIYLVSGLLHYAPLYLAARQLQDTAHSDPVGVRIFQMGSDRDAIRAALRSKEPSSIPLVLTSLNDLNRQAPGLSISLADLVLWFSLVQRPFLALCCRKDDYKRIHQQFEAGSGTLRLACYPEGSTARSLVNQFFGSRLPSLRVEMVDIEFPRDGFFAVESKAADVGVTLRPWDFQAQGKKSQGRLLCSIPSRPFGFSCGLTHRQLFESQETRSVLERLSKGVTEAVYLIYNSFDPFWSFADLPAWSSSSFTLDPGSRLGATEVIEVIRSFQFLQVRDGSSPVTVDPPGLTSGEVEVALSWMASSQIWSFDSLEIPRLERMSTPGHPELGSSVLTAKTLMLEEIAKEAEASRLYEEVSPILQSISRKQAALKEIAEDLDRVQVRLDPIGWSAGLEYLQKLAEALEACFDQTHEPDRLSPEEVFELHEKIVDQAQSRKFFDAIASFRESCLKPLDALPGSVVKSLFRPLFSLARPHEAKPSDRRALEIVFFAKALSKMMIPGLWLEAILARVPQRPGIGRIPFGLLYANPQGPGQVQLIRSLNSFVSEATKVDNIDLQEDQLIVEVYMKARADGGMSGIKNLQEAIVAINDEGFDSWHKGASGARVGKTLRAIRALSQLPTSIDTTVSPNEGLNLKLKVEISRHSLPTGERWPSLTP